MSAMHYGLRDWAEREPNRPAIDIDGERTTYGELERLTNRLANLMHDIGLRRGDHVATVFANGPHALALAWACYRSGLYFTPVATTLAANEVVYVATNCQAKVVFASYKYASITAGLPGAVPATKFFSLGGEIPGYQSLENALASADETPLRDETPGAIMLYSSGTTGAPKGVWRPLPSIEQVGDGPPLFARDLLSFFDIRSTDRYLSPGPLYHAAPLRWSLSFLAAGASVVLMSRFDAEKALSLLENDGITFSQFVPTMCHRMLGLPEARRAAFRAPQHRMSFTAGAPISVALKQAMIDWWGPIMEEYYGGSESVGLTSLSCAEWLAKRGSVGKTRRGPIYILDDNDEPVPAGTTGRVFFSGTSQFQYFGEPGKTAARTSKQGYQSFGDIGHLDEDGYLFLSDRQDDMIISGGVNVYPQEIEQALEQAPGVREAGVVGIKDPDFGEVPVAFIVTDQPDESALRAYCRERLGKTKQPKEFRFVASLPRSDAGKLLRRVLRDGLKG